MKQMNFNAAAFFSTFYAFLLTVIFIMVNIIVGLGAGLFSSKSIIKSINRSDYFEKTYEDVKINTENILYRAGLPTTILSDVITRDRIHISGMDYVGAVLDNKEPQLGQDIREEIINKIREYFKEEGIIETGSLPAELQQISAAIEQEYTGRIQLRIVDYLMEYRQKYNRAVVIVMPCMIIMIIIISYLLIRIQRYKHRGVRYISYALFASSIFTIILALYLILKKGYSAVMVKPDHYYELISDYLHMNIKVLAYIGLFGFAAALASVKVVDFMKKQIIRPR